jgi:hypothetical protein
MTVSDVERAIADGAELVLLLDSQEPTEPKPVGVIVRQHSVGIYTLRITRRGGGLTLGDQVRARPAELVPYSWARALPERS